MLQLKGLSEDDQLVRIQRSYRCTTSEAVHLMNIAVERSKKYDTLLEHEVDKLVEYGEKIR